MRRFWFGLTLVVACSGGENERHPAMPAGAGSSTGGKAAAAAGTKATTNAGDAGDAGEQGGSDNGAGGAGDGGMGAALEIGGAPVLAPPGVCDPVMKLGKAQVQDVGVPAATLLSMTADERSVAFTTGADDSLALHVADRAAASGDFADQLVTLPDGFDAKSGVALSSDGLKLVVVMSDHSGFAELSRASRSAAFAGDADPTPFAPINQEKPMSGHSVGWPVLSADGKTLYFLSYFGQGLVRQSERDKSGVFDPGTEIDEFTLGGQEGAYKLLNGVSSDQRAIFFFDQETSHQMALFRSAPGAPFYDPLDLGERRGATPNTDCSLVYSSNGSGVVAQPTE
jgi:WD40-like Beta Propeller Repeat